MKRFLLLAACTIGIIYTHAQTSVSGKIVDAESKIPIERATISRSGKTIGYSENDGSFNIECSEGMKISVSAIGYETFFKTVKNCNEAIEIALTPAYHNLNAIEITATTSKNKSILYQPSSITKITTTELKRGTGLFLDDAINSNIPGVTMQRRTVSAGQQFNIRGYGNGIRGTNGPASNFDGQGYKVYLNGIAVTDAEGITLMDDIDFGSIGNVEVVKGPVGTLYGLAIAGVMNLKTMRPEAGKISAGQETIIGNYGLKRSTTSFQMGREKSSLLLNYGYQSSDGFMAHTASTKRFVNVAGEFDVNDKQSISTYAGFSNSYDQRGGELTIDQYNNNDYSGNPAYIKNNAHTHVTSFRGGVAHSFKFNKYFSNTTSLFGTGMATDASSAGGWTDKNPINYGVRSTVDAKFALSPVINLNGITGVETQAQYAETIGYTMGTNSADPGGYNIITGTRSNQYTRSGTLSYFTEWTLALPQDLSITAGIGNSNMKIELNDRIYAANKPTYFFKKFDNMVSPHLAINKVFNKALSLYAAYSKGYKAPVSSYFFIPYAAGVNGTGIVNPVLQPEVSTQYEAGSKGSLIKDKLSYQLAFFNAFFKDKMAAVAVPNATNTATLYSYIVNAGRQHNKGIEALVRYTLVDNATGFFKSIRPFANLTYADFKYENYKFQFSGTQAPINYDGKPVAGVAKLTANAGIDLGFAYGFYANAVYNYKDPVLITLDGANKTHSYNLLNAKVGFKRSLSTHFDVDAYVAANNITAAKYYYMVFVNQLPDVYMPAPKNTFYFGGLNVKYNF